MSNDELRQWARLCLQQLADAVELEQEMTLRGLPGMELLQNDPSYAGALEKIANDTRNAMQAAPHHSVPQALRNTYSDSIILWSLLDIINKTSADESEIFWEAVISRLDHAIVIAGAPGECRADLVLEIIERTQRAHLPLGAKVYTPLEAKNPPKPESLWSAAREVLCFTKPPSLSSFMTQYVDKPFVVRSLASEWPALTDHPWSSKTYLRQVAGRGRVVPVEIGKDYRATDWTQKMMHWDEFLDYIFPDHNSPLQSVMYLAQHDLFQQFPALRADVIIPDYVYASPQTPHSFPSYKPPSNIDQLVMNVWLGPQGTISPAHTDPFFNCYFQVVGNKTVWLAPPDLTAAMSPYTHPDVTSCTNTNHDRHHNPASNNLDPLLSNTSVIDVFSESSSSSPDQLSEFTTSTLQSENSSSDPSIAIFKKKVVPQALSVVLEPGDMLFFPPGWWHAMRSEDNSFSVSMWF